MAGLPPTPDVITLATKQLNGPMCWASLPVHPLRNPRNVLSQSRGCPHRFFATVFFGSALLFLAMLFAAAAILGALVLAFAAQPNELINSTTFYFARAVAYSIMNVYATQMAAVFMTSTSTVVIYTGIAPVWIAVLGYALALAVLLGSYFISWSFFVLPLWVFLISVYVLIDNFRQTGRASPDSDG
jgi:hypothetical protein